MTVIPDQVKTALKLLEEAGFEAYMVGGCVRDNIMGREPSDYDITSSAIPDEIKSVFNGYRVVETGLQHGTVTVIVDEMLLEITTYRREDRYADNRHPDNVEFTKSLREDMSRRDFTINAIAYNDRDGFVDYFGGMRDIKSGIIRCVGNPEERFEEDALRIMRALRFSSATGFEIEEKTLAAAVKHKTLLKNISAERFREELVKLLCGVDVRRCLMRNTEILGVIIPELIEMNGFDQKNKHHIYDILEHTAAAVEAVPARSELRLAALLHDIGKPRCFSMDSDGEGHFYNHAEIGSEMARDIMRRLKFDSATTETVTKLVRLHGVQTDNTEKSVKRALNKMSPELFFELLQLKKADNLAQNSEYHHRQAYYTELEELAKRIIENEECFSLKDLALNGDDLIALDFAPGKEMGELLDRLLEAVITGKVPNERSALEKFALDMAKNY